MKTRTYKRKRRKSKFDPYLEEITEYIEAGMSIREIAEKLSPYFEDAVADGALYSFIESRGLHSKVTMGGRNKMYDIPLCSKCDECWEIQNTAYSTVQLCVPCKRLVNRSCKTSPMWCPKRNINS